MSSRFASIVLAVLLTACGPESNTGGPPWTPPPDTDTGGPVKPDAGTSEPPQSSGPCVTQKADVFSSTEDLRRLEGCREVTGDIFIARTFSTISDLSPLSQLEVVKGSLSIHKLDVTDLDALRSLRRVEGHLSLTGNAQLTRVDGLRALESVGEGVYVFGNGALLAVEGWSALTTVGGGLVFEQNYGLTRITGLERLQKVGGELRFDWNPKLETVADMPALATAGEFTLQGADLRTGLTGFGKLRTLSALRVGRTTRLSEVNAFAGVTELGALSFYNNSQLVAVKGLPGGRTVKGSVVVSDNPLLSQFEPLRSLVSIEKWLTVSKLPMMKSLESFRGLESVEGEVRLEELAVVDLSDFPALAQIGGRLSIRGNAQLTSIKGLAALRQVGEATHSVGEQGLFVAGNPKLQSLEGLEKITTLATLLLQDNASLIDLTGLQALRRVDPYFQGTGGNVTLSRLPRLRNLQGLEALTSVRNTLSISECDALERLTGTEALQSVSIYRVFKNPQLPPCEVEKLRQQVRPTESTVSDNTGTGTCP